MTGEMKNSAITTVFHVDIPKYEITITTLFDSPIVQLAPNRAVTSIINLLPYDFVCCLVWLIWLFGLRLLQPNQSSAPKTVQEKKTDKSRYALRTPVPRFICLLLLGCAHAHTHTHTNAHTLRALRAVILRNFARCSTNLKRLARGSTQHNNARAHTRTCGVCSIFGAHTHARTIMHSVCETCGAFCVLVIVANWANGTTKSIYVDYRDWN